MAISDDIPGPIEERRARPRRRWSWRTRFRVALILLLLLVLAGWRYGWPPRSMETTVTSLEEIGWLEAARLCPECVNSESTAGRHVILSPGSLHESGRAIFDLDQKPLVDRAVLPLRRQVIPELKLPDLGAKSFYSGVFWVDMPASHDEDPANELDPALAYAVLLSCKTSQRWEQAAELIIDMNRNRDLTDDPVMTISDAWSHKDEDSYTESDLFVRVFEPVKLARAASGQENAESLPVAEDAVPVLQVSYRQKDGEMENLDLAFFPTSFRKGRLKDAGEMRDVVIAPDPTRFGRFDGARSTCFCVDDGYLEEHPFINWTFDRGSFRGGEMDAEGRELRTGPYRGPTGALRVETAAGKPLRMEMVEFLLRGNSPHTLSSWGWTPIPRLWWYRLPIKEHLLPVGQFEISSLWLVGDDNSSITVYEGNFEEEQRPQTFSIRDGRTTTFRLPASLKMKVLAALDIVVESGPDERIWSTDSEHAAEISEGWKGPSPGCKVTIEASMTDPSSGNRYSVYPGDSASQSVIRIAIRDEAGKIVHEGTMEYG